MRKSSVVMLGSAALVGLALAGCSTSTSAPSSPPTTAPSAISPSESPTSSPMESTVLPPIMIDGQKAQNVAVGDTLDVISKDVTKISTDNAEVLKVSQPRDDGSAQFNAGAEVIAAGTATLVVSGKDGELYSVKITAVEK